jgi:hypothetical protein
MKDPLHVFRGLFAFLLLSCGKFHDLFKSGSLIQPAAPFEARSILSDEASVISGEVFDSLPFLH